MPHRQHCNLPVLTKEDVSKKFVEYHLKRYPRIFVPVQAYFYRVWKHECPEIKTRRRHGFAECSRCVLLKSQIYEKQENGEEVEHLPAQLATHIKLMQEERRGYRLRCERAERYPHKYCSMVLDGADQKSFGLPHLVIKSKSDKGHKLKVKCVGVLEHRINKKLSLYTMTDEFETGANHVIEAAHRTLQARKHILGRLPEVLYFQADNCTRENKNRYFLAYFEMLVAMGVFVVVEISFLPVGHTHTDIDQAFSAVSRHLRDVNTVTMGELLHELKQCYSPKAEAEYMSRIANFSGLCDASKCLRKVRAFTKFRYFRFTRAGGERNEEGYFSTSCHVKVQGYDSWSPLSTGISAGFLKFVPDLSATPLTVTAPPDDVVQVNQCLRSLEERRIESSRLRDLRELKNQIYRNRCDTFHWNLEECFETNGEYIISSPYDDREAPEITEENAESFEYEPNTFVACKAPVGDSFKFWIAKVLRVEARASDNVALWLGIRWYQAKGNDEFTARYVPCEVFNPSLKQHIPFEDQLEPRSVLVQFHSLSSLGKLLSNTCTAIRQMLDLH